MLFLKNAKNLVFLNAYLWRESNGGENKKGYSSQWKNSLVI